MQNRESIKSRTGMTGFLQKFALFFLIGFFCGALLYYIFQNSFGELIAQMEKNVQEWGSGERQPGYEFLRSLWIHGKYFLLLWLLSVSRAAQWYPQVFTLYTGLRQGFLALFFIFGRGAAGILVYLAGLFPQNLILLPLYLFCFYRITQDRQRRHPVAVYVLVTVVFLAACLSEARFHLPIMEAVL